MLPVSLRNGRHILRNATRNLENPLRQQLKINPGLQRASFATVNVEQYTVIPRHHKNSGKAPYAQEDKILVFSDVSNRHVEVSNIWLRDHCQCSSCFHDVTKQRIIETFDEISPNIEITQGGIIETNSKDGFDVTWNDGHKSFYSKDWLSESGLKLNPRASERHALSDLKFWTGEEIKSSPPSVDYKAIMESEDGLKEWLEKIRVYGFSYVENCPVTPSDTENLLKRISFIRNTHYGGFYDFTADLASGDTAYTQLGIGPHTDNTYFSDPAGLQMFHLLSHTQGTGGKSQLIDGFGAAQQLLEEDPKAYEVLSSTRIYSHASGGNDISIQPFKSSPVLVHDPQGGFLVQVRWNTTDRAAIDTPIEKMPEWYDAARKWTRILKKREYWEQLQPGRPLIFDNWRVLHGRSAFTGNRRMCGGYINRDDYISKYRIMTLGRDTVLKQVARG